MKRYLANWRQKLVVGDWRYWLVPSLIGIYPVLYLYNRNLEEVKFGQTIWPIIGVILLSFASFWLLQRWLSDKLKLSLSLSLFWLFFFSYGLAYGHADWLLAKQLVKHQYLWPLWLLIMAFCLYKLWRARRPNPAWLKASGIFAGVLLVTPLWGIARHSLFAEPANSYGYLLNTETKILKNPPAKPNIYYIMLDSYPRADSLRHYFGYDNRTFIKHLTDAGFVVADKSHANYNLTAFTVPATLNMSYLKDVYSDANPNATQSNLYVHNKVMEYLRSGGYKIVNNSTLPQAAFNPLANVNTGCAKSSDYRYHLINQTMLKPFKVGVSQTRHGYRQNAWCIIDNMAGPAVRGGPKFVFSHLFPPHPPYIFGANGEDVREDNLSLTADERWQAKAAYVAQLKYVNKRVGQVVRQILSQDPQSVIIIQSDHATLSSSKVEASDLKSPNSVKDRLARRQLAKANNTVALNDRRPEVLIERSRNFTAIHLPDGCQPGWLYPAITNVNTFRMVFNACFDADFERLPDRVYYAAGFKIYNDITKIVGN